MRGTNRYEFEQKKKTKQREKNVNKDMRSENNYRNDNVKTIFNLGLTSKNFLNSIIKKYFDPI